MRLFWAREGLPVPRCRPAKARRPPSVTVQIQDRGMGPEKPPAASEDRYSRQKEAHRPVSPGGQSGQAGRSPQVAGWHSRQGTVLRTELCSPPPPTGAPGAEHTGFRETGTEREAGPRPCPALACDRQSPGVGGFGASAYPPSRGSSEAWRCSLCVSTARKHAAAAGDTERCSPHITS